MKRWLSLAVLTLAVPLIAHGQSSSLWKLTGTKLQPVVRTWKVIFPSGASGSGLFTLSSYRNCSLETTSTGAVICGTDATGGGGSNWSNTGSILTAADSKYVNIGGDTMTGALTIAVTGGSQNTLGLRVINTASGAVFHAQKALRSSGSLAIESGAVIGGYVGIGTSTPIRSLQIEGDAPAILLHDTGGAGARKRYQFRMDGDQLNIQSLSDAGAVQATVILDVDGNMTLPNNLTILGTTLSLAGGTNIFTTGMIGLNADANIQFNTGGAQVLETPSNDPIFFRNNAGLNIMRFGASGYSASGARLHAEQSLTSSGAVTWEGAASGATLYLGGRLEGVGLTDCDADNQTVSWDVTSGRFGCGDDDTGASSPEVGTASFTGAVVRLGNSQWVNQSGDTMTGALTINLTTGYLGLKVIQTASGSIFHAEKNLSSSGTLAWETSATGNTLWSSVIRSGQSLNSSGSVTWEGSASGASIWVSKFDGAGLTDCDLTTNKVLWDTTLKRFSCSTDLNTGSVSTGALLGAADRKYVNLGGDTMTGALAIAVTGGVGSTVGLRVINTASGAVFHAEKTLSSSGTVAWEGAASGSQLFGLGLVDCDTALTSKLLYDFSTGRFACGTDQSSGLPAGGSTGQILINQGVSTAVWRNEKTYERFVLAGPQVQAAVGSGLVFPMAFSGVLIDANLQASGVASGATVQVVIAGTRVFTTALSVDRKETNSATAATPVVISSTASRFNKLATMRIDMTAVGSYASSGVVLTLWFDKRSP